MVSTSAVVIDGRAHMYGRLASVVAKQLLQGQSIVVVRAEQMVISGSLIRNKVKYAQFLKKRHNTNPKRGPFHYRSPARMFWRSVRGMVPQKTKRGQIALSRLAVFEGIPPPYDKKKRMVVPQALKVIRLAPGRKCCVLGRLASEVGWKHAELVGKLESKRKIESEAFYQEKKAARTLRDRAVKEADLSAVEPVLEAHGFA